MLFDRAGYRRVLQKSSTVHGIDDDDIESRNTMICACSHRVNVVHGLL